MASGLRYAINVIEDTEGRVLLLQRSPDAKLGARLWGFCGGHIEPGETPRGCSERELREELGSCHTVVLQAQLGPVRDSYYGGRFEVSLFHYLWRGGNIRLNAEHTRYAWVSRQEYRSYSVMDGVDEDIDYFRIWPRQFLNPDRLPRGRPPLSGP